MSWPYRFVTLSQDEIHTRRELLDRYGIYSQISAVVPILAYRLYRLGRWVFSERQRSKPSYSAVPSSPNRKKTRSSSFDPVRAKWRSLIWWLGGEVAPTWGLGLNGQWVATAFWVLWLGFLSVHRTGDDYLHVTKRIGQVAVAQFPLQYMLAMKIPSSPLGLAFRASHEELNPWHRLNGKVIYSLLLCHVTLYLNFFVQVGVLNKRLNDRDVIIGITAFSLFTILGSSALKPVRHWNYRLFFVLHLIVGITLPPLLFFHASHLRIYVVEALAFYVLDVIFRKYDTITSHAEFSSVPNTNLIKIKVPISPAELESYREAPGQHVYLSIPPRSTPAGTTVPSIHDLLYNPFTVAEVSESDITLVARALSGPTSKALRALVKLPKAKPPINIEGPYGGSQHFPNLPANYDRILLVAGGVGSTFILPFYRALRNQMGGKSSTGQSRLKLVWSMRSAAEADWAIESEESKAAIEEDESIKIFVSRSNADGRIDTEEEIPVDGGVELDEMDPKQERLKANGGRDRPDLEKIVDEVFKCGKEERVAIMVCGPTGMARELRGHVGRWVHKGREVWFHNESFGF